MYKHLSMFIKILCVFFVLKRFYLTFKVVHVHESISYVILYIFAVVFIVCMFTVCLRLCLFAWLYLILCICVCTCVFRLHNKGEYQFTKIFVLVKGIKKFNFFF